MGHDHRFSSPADFIAPGYRPSKPWVTLGVRLPFYVVLVLFYRFASIRFIPADTACFNGRIAPPSMGTRQRDGPKKSGSASACGCLTVLFVCKTPAFQNQQQSQQKREDGYYESKIK